MPQQVALHVRIAEVNDRAARELADYSTGTLETGDLRRGRFSPRRSPYKAYQPGRRFTVGPEHRRVRRSPTPTALRIQAT
jgi:hypothetical protein